VRLPGLLAFGDDVIVAGKHALDKNFDQVGQEPPGDDVGPRDQNGQPTCEKGLCTSFEVLDKIDGPALISRGPNWFAFGTWTNTANVALRVRTDLCALILKDDAPFT
jgi:hypothetical protein